MRLVLEFALVQLRILVPSCRTWTKFVCLSCGLNHHLKARTSLATIVLQRRNVLWLESYNAAQELAFVFTDGGAAQLLMMILLHLVLCRRPERVAGLTTL